MIVCIDADVCNTNTYMQQRPSAWMQVDGGAWMQVDGGAWKQVDGGSSPHQRSAD
jgi:hypothetical protein